jgi:hypothetical protein
MSVVLGRGRGGVLSVDRVYAMVTLPPEPRTFKLVIGWEQPDRLRDRFPPTALTSRAHQEYSVIPGT